MGRKYKGPIFGPFLFLVNKKKDESSFDVIRTFKKMIGPKLGKIGHFGTLDPFAEGLLLVGIGGATRLNQFTEEFTKEYIATGEFGVKSPTGDFTCPIEQLLNDENSSPLAENEVLKALESFLGEYLQAPHTYSAAKHEGKALYEWAREGVQIKKDPVKRYIHEIEILNYEYPSITFRVKVSHGTYIRVLMEDLAEKLDTFGALKELKRTKIGHLSLDDAFVMDNQTQEELISNATSLTRLLNITEILLDEVHAKRYQNGQKLKVANHKGGLVWIRSDIGYLGLGSLSKGILRAEVNFPKEFQVNPDLSILSFNLS